MEEQKDLPKPLTDLPLPEKDLPVGRQEISAQAGLAMKKLNLKWVVILLLLLGVGLIAIIGGKYYLDQKKLNSITDFESCAQAGYPVMESYPGRCITPDGRSFTQILSKEEQKKLLPPSDLTADWKTYTHTEYDYSIKYPTGWNAYSLKDYPYPDDPGIGDLNTLVVTTLSKFPEFSVGDGTGDAYIGFQISKLDQDFEEYASRLKNDSKNNVEVKESNVNGNKAYKVTQADGDIGWLISNNAGVDHISISVLSNSAESKDIAIIEQIISTFTFAPLSASKPTDSNKETQYQTPTVAPKTTTPQVNGASLENIKYTLPSGWTNQIRDGGLEIKPGSGGYLFIKVYNYDGTTGRRDAYCKIVSYCTSSSYFTTMNIGNISGYKANALDNSGGGADYLGIKGNKLYIISTYNPPSPNEYEKNFQNVLNSLIF